MIVSGALAPVPGANVAVNVPETRVAVSVAMVIELGAPVPLHFWRPLAASVFQGWPSIVGLTLLARCRARSSSDVVARRVALIAEDLDRPGQRRQRGTARRET